jgi:hypothetical protein
MRSRLPTILSVVLLLAVLAVAVVHKTRTPPPPSPEPATAPVTPSPAPPEPAPSRPTAQDRDGLVGPAGIAEALPAFQRCYADHGADEGHEPGLTLIFTVAVDPQASRPMAKVADVRVKHADDQPVSEASPFESCLEQAVTEIEMVPPGGRDQLDIPMAFQLGG